MCSIGSASRDLYSSPTIRTTPDTEGQTTCSDLALCDELLQQLHSLQSAGPRGRPGKEHWTSGEARERGKKKREKETRRAIPVNQ